MRLFVGGISFSTSSDSLRTLFAEVGSVTEATVVSDKFSGQSKGFGFIEMPNEAEAQAAIQRFNGKTVDGRSLTVNEAKPRENNGGGGGYGGGSGGGGNRRW